MLSFYGHFSKYWKNPKVGIFLCRKAYTWNANEIWTSPVTMYFYSISQLGLTYISCIQIMKKSIIGKNIYKLQHSPFILLAIDNLRRPGISNLHRQWPLGVSVHTLPECSLGDLFPVPKNSRFPRVGSKPRTSRFAVERTTTWPTCAIKFLRMKANDCDITQKTIMSMWYTLQNNVSDQIPVHLNMN